MKFPKEASDREPDSTASTMFLRTIVSAGVRELSQGKKFLLL
ncbi:hypothetical protein [Coleofasciculus sp. H7-2]